MGTHPFGVPPKDTPLTAYPGHYAKTSCIIYEAIRCYIEKAHEHNLGEFYQFATSIVRRH